MKADSSDSLAVPAMSYIPGKNVLNPVFLLNSNGKKQGFAESVINGMIKWHDVVGEKFGDLNIMNIMANSKNFELTGFIDPCGSMWADREYDLYQLRNMWGDRFFLYDTYKKFVAA